MLLVHGSRGDCFLLPNRFTEETESKHPVFGKVTRGLEVLEAISGVKKLKKDESRPAKPIKVEHVEVSEIHQRFL